LTLGGERAGTVSTAVATAPFFARVRGAERRVVLLVFLAMVGVVGLAVGLSRLVTRQMRPLIETNRALGRGDLGARAPVFGRDELGEVAAGLNVMAEQLQASYAELEMRVAARTEELQRVYDELEAVLRARTEVFAAVSHEFRSPLFAILGHADLMDDPAFKPQGRRWRVEFAHTIRQSAQMLLGRVNELLDIARVESTSVELFREDVRLADVVGDLRLTMAALARRAGLDLLLDIPESLPPVNADAARLREVVLNLVSNAVKYTPASGTVTVRASSVNGHVSVTVTDTGRGIPATATERIFEPFYRIDGAGSEGAEPSTGLGLAIVQRLVRAHGGDVTCRSEPGRGSTFTFTLPSADSVVSAPADAGRTAGVGGVSDAAGGAAIEADGEPANQQS
jgi:signal transduction histidine kinase